MLRGINCQGIFEGDEDYLQMTSCLQALRNIMTKTVLLNDHRTVP